MQKLISSVWFAYSITYTSVRTWFPRSKSHNS